MTGARNGTGKRDGATRERLLDATVEVMLDEGYAAATSRRVAERAGVRRALVHYYFPTMDELFLAVLRRGSQANLQVQRQALSGDAPLRALWEMTADPRGARLVMEFMALGNHRKAIRAELAAGAAQFREAQVAALSVILRGRGEAPPAEVLSVVLAAIGRVLVIEQGLGIEIGHAATRELFEGYLSALEPRG
ncbi:TetR/AcrR family transcriptional regulator [Nocardia asteroides]|uniref:TetR/AcrR family transcriptional regulator n=1 Tax=Nocardia asteroides TaxID=1824 RepID=UPI001E65B17D|nr:TetR/AcrR family transcriptional regulator [Nocardia asteroides]UGT62013.1 TetR/AcrR family transcriptional regulator [Nocardia asteroides]